MQAHDLPRLGALAALTLTLFSASAPLRAADGGAEPPKQLETQVLDTEFDQLPDTQLMLHSRALAKAVHDARARQKEELATLTAQFLAERDAARADELQRRIHLLKLQAEIEILRLQTEHARELGASKLVDEAAATLKSLAELVELERARMLPAEVQR